MFELNYLAILASAVLAFVTGGLWYGPLFGKAWIKLMGWTPEKIDEIKKKGGMGKAYALQFVGALVMSYVLAHFVLGWASSARDTDPISIGLQTGFWLWLGFVAPTMMGKVLWEGKSWKLYALDAGYYLMNLLLMSALLGLWQ